jgi:DNA-binding NarL/FixJ family response regulator
VLRLGRVLVVDDHPVVRQGIASVLEQDPRLSVVGTTSDAAGAREFLRNDAVDVVVCDLSLPGVSGLTLVKEIRESWPQVRVLVLSMHDPLLYAERALRAGASGYLSKDESPERIVEGVVEVLGGDQVLPTGVFGRVAERSDGAVPESPASVLSDRELEVFELTGRGQGTRRVAEVLGISIKTVETHKSNIRTKLGLADAGELLRSAVAWLGEVDGARA